MPIDFIRSNCILQAGQLAQLGSLGTRIAFLDISRSWSALRDSSRSKNSEDQIRELIEKCRNYEQAGVSHSFVFDPTAQVIYRWEKDLVETPDLELPNGSLISGTAIWQELQAAKLRVKMTL